MSECGLIISLHPFSPTPLCILCTHSLVKIPELSQACTEMAREMEKAGLIEEVIDDAMDAVDVSACPCLLLSSYIRSCMMMI